MSPNLKSEKHKVVSTGKIDGGAYRAVETPDGGAMVEEWKDGAWVPGGAGYGEVREAPQSRLNSPPRSAFRSKTCRKQSIKRPPLQGHT
jgi:hypothetical protein